MADSLMRAGPIPSHGRLSRISVQRRKTTHLFVLVLPSTLRLIITELWALESFDKPTIAKYMRCLLQSTLAGPPDQSIAVMEDICNAVKTEVEVRRLLPHSYWRSY